MTDRDCEGGILTAQDTAAELYQLSALMLGNETQALELVEATVAATEVDPCAEGDAAVEEARRRIVETAVAQLSQADPNAFAAPVLGGSGNVTCIEGDDLSAAGISTSQLAKLVSGTGRRTLRDWLNQLPLAQRAIFVERAVLGWDNAATASALSEGSKRVWQPQQVSEVFRQALCSLATSLVHSAAQS